MVVPTRVASGLECVTYTTEVIELELESVSEDGAPVADTSAYAGFDVMLEGSPYGGGSAFMLIAVTNEQDTWLEKYR
jgi:hypothetical protein